MTSHSSFKARFPGRCAYCQDYFDVGDPIKRLETPVRVLIERWDHRGTHRVEKMKYAHVGCEEPRYQELRDEAKQMAQEQDTGQPDWRER